MKLENGLYVGCALTYAPEEFIEGIVEVKSGLKEKGYNVLEFVGDKECDPEEVYRHDIEECAEKCDAMLAVIDYPSIGLGFELDTTSRLGIPTLMVAKIGQKVTRFALGAAIAKPSLEFEEYRQMQEIPDQFDRFANRFNLVRAATNETL